MKRDVESINGEPNWEARARELETRYLQWPTTPRIKNNAWRGTGEVSKNNIRSLTKINGI